MGNIKLGDCKPGTSFEVYAVKQENEIGKFFNYINQIDPDHARWYGQKKEDVIKVKCTIVDNDISVKELYSDPNYDDDCIDYLMGYNLWSGNMIIMPNVKAFNCCYPRGADESRFAHHTTSTYKKGDRMGYLCRLKVEEINKPQ